MTCFIVSGFLQIHNYFCFKYSKIVLFFVISPPKNEILPPLPEKWSEIPKIFARWSAVPAIPSKTGQPYLDATHFSIKT